MMKPLLVSETFIDSAEETDARAEGVG